MKCLKKLYKLIFRRKEAPNVKLHTPSLNESLVIHDLLTPTYTSTQFSSTC